MLVVYMEFVKKKEGNVCESKLIRRRVSEFKSAMECIIDYLNRRGFDRDRSDVVKVLMLEGWFDWVKRYSMIKRECKRLDDGLHIYANHQDILLQIHSQQVMVLISQLVQFLVDGANHQDILLQIHTSRVQEEAYGCLDDNQVVYSSTYLRQLDAKDLLSEIVSLERFDVSCNRISERMPEGICEGGRGTRNNDHRFLMEERGWRFGNIPPIRQLLKTWSPERTVADLVASAIHYLSDLRML
ncbi:hypothetical protein M8C21_019433 [Ambrosia artemisiifolia]|uniref:Uncharacterized protein n=1 Tax=Ambrosia artemisiifolia TaxID=4212 RepID=A0AAD5BTA7_AMBAR|nr:hypothetical protein M8C21_019433 [Ambrosia artemisiifolia]